MGKTRLKKWGLFLLLITLCSGILLHTFVINDKNPPPSPLPEPQQSGPLAGLRICIDPGHGGYDGGARGRNSRVAEKELNLDVALRLAALLKAQGAAVVLTRETDVTLADPGENRKRRDLQLRVDCAQQADLFLSIHMNEYRAESQSGPQVFYKKGEDASRLLAGTLQEAMNAALAPVRSRHANTGEYYLLEHLTIPAVLVECGFLSNGAEEQKLLTQSYRAQIAEAIARGVLDYVQLQTNLANAG